MVVFKLASPDRIAIEIPYDEESVNQMRLIPGRKWDSQAKSWSVPNNPASLETLLNIVKGARIKVHESLMNTAAGEYIQKVLRTGEKEKGGILNAVNKKLILRGLSPKTIKAYMDHINRFREYLSRPLDQTSSDEIKQYIFKLIDQDKCSHSYAGQAISALKYLFEDVLNNKEILLDLPRPKTERKLPDVLSQEEVLSVLNSITNPKHKALMVMIYSSGLRVGEVVRLKIEDIDSQRMMVHIRQGKGKKDRFTMLSKHALTALRDYFRRFRPEVWLFPGGKED